VSFLILDSSATLAWIYGDETTEAIRRVFDAVADNGALVPALWRLEVANSLTMAVRKRRIDPDFRRAALADLALLDITTDQQTGSYAWTRSLPATRYARPGTGYCRNGDRCDSAWERTEIERLNTSNPFKADSILTKSELLTLER
jgi:predicted nucleic acid-binding protein